MAGRHRAETDAKKRPPRVTEMSDFIAMLCRNSVALRRRLVNDPAGLVQALEFQEQLKNDINAAIFLMNEGQDHYSMDEVAAILGVSRQAVQQRAHRGRDWLYAESGTIRIADLREARRRLLAANGVVDRTGSERERALRVG